MTDNHKATEPTSDPLSKGLRAAFGDDRASASRVLRQLDVRSVCLQDADEQDDAPVVIDEAAKALRDPSGRYQVLGEIGRGGVGIVYKGRDVDLGRDVAMKVLREEHAAHPEMLARFVEEAQIGGQLQHPGIVPVYELGLQHGERPYFAMKLIKGDSLAALLGKRKDPSEDRRRFLGMFEQVCQTVAYAHARRVVHRDLKPANVMIGAFGEVQVVDWGLAKILPKGGVADEAAALELQPNAVSVISTVRSRPGSGSDSVQGSMMGTPAYMPPEQALGDVTHVDRSSDVFSLGAILCEILTGKPPYASHDPLRQASRGELEPCYALLEQSGADAPLVALCRECLTPARKSRPASAQWIATRIGQYLSSVEERARTAQIRAAEAKVRAKATLQLSAAAILLLLVGGGAYLLVQHQAQTRRDQADQRVAAALHEANVRFGKASAASVPDRGLWELAIDAGMHADLLASDPDASAEQRGEAVALLAELRTKWEQAIAMADRIAKDDGMRLRLIEIRIPLDDPLATTSNWRDKKVRVMDQAYADAFQAYLGDRDIADLPLEQAVGSLRGALAVEHAAALTHWAMIRDADAFADPSNKQRTLRLRTIASALDPDDPWRAHLRLRLAGTSPEREQIEKLAAAADLPHLPATGIALLGDALSSVGAHDQAIQVLHQGCDQFPQDLGLCIQLAEEQQEVGLYSDLVATCRTAVALCPSSGLVRTSLADALAFTGRFDDACANYDRAIALNPTLCAPHFGLGRVLAVLGATDAAIASYRTAIALNPQEAMTYNNLGNVLYRQDRLEEAISRLTLAVALGPDNWMAHCNLGLARVKKGEYDEAIACFQHALELSPQDVNSLSGLGAALMHQGKADDAIRYLRIASEHLLSGHASALDERSDLVDAGIVCANLGKALEQQGRLDEAVAILQQALTIDPANADAHFTLGTTFFRQGHFEEAIECQRHVLELEPRAADALLELGRAQYRLGILDGAIVSFQGVIDLVPASIDARVALGTALCDRGDFDGAVACFHLAIEQDKDSASAHLGLGITLNMQGRHDDASVSLGRAVELDPTSAAANCELGMALTALGRLDDAILKLNRALDLAPNDPGCLNALGVACVKQGTLDDAIAHYTEALRIDPTFAEAHVNLGSVLEARGELEAAMDSMGRARELFAQRCDASSRNWASVVEKELSSLAARMARRQAIARLLRGEPQATTAGDPTAEDWTDVAQSAYAVHQYTAAARTFSLGFSALPEMLRSYPIRYNAACAAALAGCGKGSDAEELEEGERSAFRAQARAWLAAELERWREDFSAGGESARSAKEHVALAESDPDFDSVRDEAALQGLPDAEAQSWRVLWRDIAELIAVGEGKK